MAYEPLPDGVNPNQRFYDLHQDFVMLLVFVHAMHLESYIGLHRVQLATFADFLEQIFLLVLFGEKPLACAYTLHL